MRILSQKSNFQNWSCYFLLFLFRFFLSPLIWFLVFFGFHSGPVVYMGLDQPGMNFPWCWFKSSSSSLEKKSATKMPPNAPPRMPPRTPTKIPPKTHPKKAQKTYLTLLNWWICQTCWSNSSFVSKQALHSSHSCRLKWKLLTWFNKCL